jgi:hypothetical protein
MTDDRHESLSTADLAAAMPPDASQPMPERRAADGDGRAAPLQDKELAALFDEGAAHGFRTRWDEIQSSFVDDPRAAVKQADELVAQVMKNLAETFARERSELEQAIGQDAGTSSTEGLRVALRRYRSFFQRLLSL